MDQINQENLRQSLAASTHLHTLAGVMSQNGIDLLFASGEGPHKLRFAVILVAEEWSEQAEQIAQAIAKSIADERAKRKHEADRN